MRTNITRFDNRKLFDSVFTAVLFQHVLGPSRAYYKSEMLPEFENSISSPTRENDSPYSSFLVFMNPQRGIFPILMADIVTRTLCNLFGREGKTGFPVLCEFSFARTKEPCDIRMHDKPRVSKSKRVPNSRVTFLVPDNVLPTWHRHRACVWRGRKWFPDFIGFPKWIYREVAAEPCLKIKRLTIRRHFCGILRKETSVKYCLQHGFCPGHQPLIVELFPLAF
mmetsp:Transcript_10048/g.24735  ORF Transcript_10048/g.24735 Transcript_10048/m.24735 type:complete len:223 (-) Transcript_10048:445-1113(-)